MTGTICVRMILMLIISMGLLVTVIYGQEDGTLNGELKKTDPKLVVIESDSDSVEIGDNIHVSGVIDRSLLGGSPSDTIILISAPDGSLADTFVLSSPDRQGEFDYSIPADVGGVWGFEALYNGINSKKVEVEAFPSDESGKTTLTLSGWPIYPRIGENVTFRGRLTDASGKGVPGREIVYESAPHLSDCNAGCFGDNKTGWDQTGSEQTDISGEYRFTILMEEEGGMNVRAIYPGDQEYRGSGSRAIVITTHNS